MPPINLRNALLTDPRLIQSRAADPRFQIGAALASQPGGPQRTPLAGLGRLSQSLAGALLLGQARGDALGKQAEQTQANEQLRSALLGAGRGGLQDILSGGGFESASPQLLELAMQQALQKPFSREVEETRQLAEAGREPLSRFREKEKIKSEFREPDKAVEQIRKEAQARAEGKRLGEGVREDVFEGKGMQAQTGNQLLRFSAKLRNGESLTQEEAAQYSFARGFAERPYIKTNEQGEQFLVTPKLDPEFFPEGPKVEAPQTPEAVAPKSEAEGKVSVERIGELSKKPPPDVAMDAIGAVADILNESTEPITGVPGTLKQRFGGFARQAGVPVSDRASRLNKALEKLKAVMTPLLLGESGKSLSDEDRRRVDRMLGSLSFGTDETELRNSLNMALEAIMSIKKK